MWWGLTNRLVLSFATLLWKVVVLCVWTWKIYDYRNEKGSKSYRSIIAIMIIMITIILPVYCNIIDALVQVTSLIFLQTTLMKWFLKQSHKSWSFRKVWKLLLQWLQLCSDENKYRHIICSSVVFFYAVTLSQRLTAANDSFCWWTSLKSCISCPSTRGKSKRKKQNVSTNHVPLSIQLSVSYKEIVKILNCWI